MTNGRNRYALDEIRRTQASAASESDDLLASILDIGDQFLQSLLRVAELIAGRPETERDEGTFLFAYQLLASKVVGHAESIRALSRMARYGDASMIIRGLMGDVMMMQYLAAYPEDVGEWFEMSNLREMKVRKGSRLAKLKGRFAESRIRTAIEKSGNDAVGPELWGIYSETAHPSLWGLQFYMARDIGELASFRFQYVPAYQQVPAFRCVVMMAGGVFDAVDIFYWWVNEKNGVDWAQEAFESWMVDRDAMMAEVESAFAWLRQSHMKLYGDPQADADQRDAGGLA